MFCGFRITPDRGQDTPKTGDMKQPGVVIASPRRHSRARWNQSCQYALLFYSFIFATASYSSFSTLEFFGALAEGSCIPSFTGHNRQFAAGLLTNRTTHHVLLISSNCHFAFSPYRQLLTLLYFLTLSLCLLVLV